MSSQWASIGRFMLLGRISKHAQFTYKKYPIFLCNWQSCIASVILSKIFRTLFFFKAKATQIIYIMMLLQEWVKCILLFKDIISIGISVPITMYYNVLKILQFVSIVGDSQRVEMPRKTMEAIKGQMVVLEAWYTPTSAIEKNTVIWNFMADDSKQVSDKSWQQKYTDFSMWLLLQQCLQCFVYFCCSHRCAWVSK